MSYADRPSTLQLPPLETLEPWPAVHARLVEYEKLREESRAVSAEGTRLLAALDQAEQADRTAYAEAIRGNAKDPGEQHLAKVRTEQRANERRRAALRVAIDGVVADIEAEMERHRPQIEAELAARIDQAEQRRAAAAAELAAAREALTTDRALLAWASAFPAQRYGKARALAERT